MKIQKELSEPKRVAIIGLGRVALKLVNALLPQSKSVVIISVRLPPRTFCDPPASTLLTESLLSLPNLSLVQGEVACLVNHKVIFPLR